MTVGLILPSNLLLFCITCYGFPKIKLHYDSLYSYMFVDSSNLFWCQKLKEGAAFKLIVMASHPRFFIIGSVFQQKVYFIHGVKS